jgi:hypothetical protein
MAMSAEEVRARAKETVKSVSELVKAMKNAAHARLAMEAPRVVNTLDGSFDRTSKGAGRHPEDDRQEGDQGADRAPEDVSVDHFSRDRPS